MVLAHTPTQVCVCVYVSVRLRGRTVTVVCSQARAHTRKLSDSRTYSLYNTLLRRELRLLFICLSLSLS